MPAKMRKKPTIFIEVAVGRAMRTQPRTTSETDIVMSFIERTLTNSFSMILTFMVDAASVFVFGRQLPDYTYIHNCGIFRDSEDVA